MKKTVFELRMPRNWTRLPTLDGYVLREFLIKFGVIMLLASILFVTGDVFNDLSDLIDKQSKSTMSQIIYYFLLKLPGNIRFVLPISVLLGCMWTMAAFGKNHEVTAMRAGGLSLFRCGGAIMAAALAVTGVNYYLNETFVPYAERRATALKLAMTKGDGEIANDQRLLIYLSPDQRRLWLFEVIDNDREFSSVNLKLRKLDGDKMVVYEELSADRVNYSPSGGWVFHDVMVQKRSTSGLVSPPAYRREMAVEGITETPAEILDSLKDMKELPIWAVWRILTKTQNMPDGLRREFMTIFWYRLTFPLSCFLAAFLAIPLAARNERSGILMAVIVAVVVIVAYVVVSEGFMIIGRRGLLNPFIAGAAPTLAFLGYGLWRITRQKV